jgi:hypothetical protein
MAVFDQLRHESDVRALAAGEVIFAEGQAGDSSSPCSSPRLLLDRMYTREIYNCRCSNRTL